MATQYHINAERFSEHLLEIKLKFQAPQNQFSLWLPAWVPGSYLIREFSRFVEQVRLIGVDGEPVDQLLVKTSKNNWQVEAPKDSELTVVYQVYTRDLSVRGSYVDAERLYLNSPSICLCVQGLEEQKHEVLLSVPEAMSEFGFACALEHTKSDDQIHFSAPNYDTLIDSPFELADQQRFAFEVAGIPHRYVISGRNRANLERLKVDLQQLCGTFLHWLPDTNFSHYLFMTIATSSDYGGLEHQHSTSLITPAGDLPGASEPKLPSENYQRYLGLCSHEYFHAWWVKWVRPTAFRTPDLSTEAYTRMLWVFEGFTSYVDDLMLYRSGLIDAKSYLKLVEAQINRYLQTPGRELQNVTESSFDAWIKLYRSDENSINATASYYNVGALCALCLDLMLRESGHQLTDLIAEVVAESKQGADLTEARLDELFSERLGARWDQFKSAHIDGAQELPLEDLLAKSGVKVVADTEDLELGIRYTEESTGLMVNRVMRGSTAVHAGISAGDLLVAIDGYKASKTILKSSLTLDRVDIHFFRRDELKTTSLTPDQTQFKKLKLSVGSADDLSKWLSCSWSQQ
jgi:predicted metalloprotease with PDZ domain